MTRTTHTHSARRARRGVTLVEMLVATAMCILGMWMLTWMFQQATASFSLANAQVTLTGQERMVTTIMQKDLEADKFPDDDTRPNRGRKLADLRADQAGYTPPRGGYFWAQSTSATSPGNSIEPTDSYGFPSSRSADHFVQFTAILPDTPGNRYYAEVKTPGPQVVAGTAAEISYFLVPTVRSAGGTQLYDLLRVQRVTAQSTYDARDFNRIAVNPGVAAGDAVDEVLTAFNSADQMQTLANLAAPGPARFAMPNTTLMSRTARQPSSKRYGEDRLMSNVLSFEIKFTGSGIRNNNPTNNLWPTPYTEGNLDYPYDTLPGPDGQFDTTPSPARPLKPIRITGAQIKIRALSGTTARQTTIVVSL